MNKDFSRKEILNLVSNWPVEELKARVEYYLTDKSRNKPENEWLSACRLMKDFKEGKTSSRVLELWQNGPIKSPFY